MSPAAPTAALLGCVERFDDTEGLGEVRLDDGRVLGFHAVAIADGTRRIAVGARVAVAVRPGHRGRYEAIELVGV